MIICELFKQRGCDVIYCWETRREGGKAADDEETLSCPFFHSQIKNSPNQNHVILAGRCRHNSKKLKAKCKSSCCLLSQDSHWRMLKNKIKKMLTLAYIWQIIINELTDIFLKGGVILLK